MGNNGSAILEGLNSEQKAAVSCVDGPVLIVAGAGSGKTRVLTSRIAYMLDLGVSPNEIMALTFTKKAAEEMKQRIALMVGDQKARKLCMGTFHSVFIRFLREFSDRIGYPSDFTIYDTSDTESAIKACLKELKIMGKDQQDGDVAKAYKPKNVRSRISMAKNNLYTAESYAKNAAALQEDARQKRPRLHEIYSLYAQKCRQAGVMDFDDILLNMNILLRDCPDVLQTLSERFRYIMVDEYQDTNFAQYLIIKKLSMTHRNICVVGDDSQSIYAFRGAKIENILNFQKDYRDNRTFRLERNYRSTKNIVNAANSLIAKNSSRIPKECYSAGEDGEKIKVIKAYTESEEAMLIASDIIRRVQRDHAQYQDFAILYRTNGQARAIEEGLRKRNLPYRVYSGNSFYERAEIKDVMAYFKLAVNINDDESFKRIVNTPARGIGDTSIAALSAASIELQCPLMKAILSDGLESFGLKKPAIERLRAFAQMMIGFNLKAKTTDAHLLAVEIAGESGIYKHYKDDTSIEGMARTQNIEELMNGVQTYIEERNNEYYEDLLADGQIAQEEELADSDFPVVTLSEFIENVSLLSAVDTPDEKDENVNNKISLMTIHCSKGLEYPYVFVAGMEENIFPSGGSLIAPNELEEERRLFYVAVTRAMKAVTLTFASTRMRNGKHESNSPSRFVMEIDRKYYENLPELSSEDGDEEGFGSSRGFGVGRSSFGTGTSSGSGSGYGSGYGFGRQGGGYQYGKSSQVKVERGSGASRTEASSGSLGSKVTTFHRPHSEAPKRVPDSEFIPTPIHELAAGQRVEHNRFGAGTILEITGDAAGKKAKISFDDFGEKLLLLNYAKIRKI